MNPAEPLGPPAALGLGAVLVLLTVLLPPARAALASRVLAFASLAASAEALRRQAGVVAGAGLEWSGPQRMVALLVLGAGLVTLLMSRRGISEGRVPEYMALILLACAGLQGLAAAADFLLVFLSVEVASVCFYILTGFLTPDPRAQEAALKYFILGSLASAVMVLGLALIGGSSPQVLGFRMAPGADPALYLPGCGALLIGLFFKVGAAPFHWWAPDAYQAAPPAAAGFMSVAPKIAAGAALLRWAERGLDGAQQGPVLAAVAAVAVVSITVGNLGALLQEEFRRFLAFSSVAHAGFLLLAPLAPAGRGWNALVLYGAAYAAMNLGSFAVAGILERRGLEGAPDGRRIENLNGLIHVSPVLGLALSVLLGSLIGIPFTAGFLGKLGLFQAAWAGGWTATVVYAAVQTVFAAGYYLRPLAGILVEPPHRAPGRFPDGEGGALAALGLCVAATLALGCFPDILLRFVP